MHTSQVLRWCRLGAGLIVTLQVGLALATDDWIARQTLAGIKTLTVVIEELDPDAQGTGLSMEVLRTDVELRLRQSAIGIEKGSSILSVNVSVLKSGERCIYLVDVGLHQTVTLVRSPKVVAVAETWSPSARFGMVGCLRAQTVLRDTVRDMVDAFLNAYLAENPRH